MIGMARRSCGAWECIAAAGAGNEQEFFARLRQAAVLVKHRLSPRNPGQVTGYAAALPAGTTRADQAVWHGGGKLATDLTLPRLRHRWPETTGHARPADARATPHDLGPRRTGMRPRRRQIRSAAASGNPTAAADAAWAAADTPHAACRGRRAGQPGPAPGRRRVRPGRSAARDAGDGEVDPA